MAPKRLVNAGHFNPRHVAILAPPKNPAIRVGAVELEQYLCSVCDDVVVVKDAGSNIGPDVILQCAVCKTFNRFPYDDDEFSPHTIFDSRRGPYTFPAARECIYCGDKKRLSREHIIPRRLAGDLVLLQCSCDRCATITGRNEQTCLRVLFRELRAHLGIGRAANRPRALQVTPKGGTGFEVPVASHPFTFLMMVTEPPAILRGVEESTWEPIGTNCRFWLYDGPDNTRRVEMLGPGITTRLYHAPDHFTLMLGKIAHAYACAKLGVHGFEHFLPTHIRSDSNRIGYYIGTDQTLFAPDRAMHTLSLIRDNSGLLIVRIRLFAHLGAPVYQVIVGRSSS